MYKITIGIRAYNDEEFIISCLDSVYNQTLDNINIIIIEDCSVDNTLHLINEYISSHKNRNIELYTHNKNLGAGVGLIDL